MLDFRAFNCYTNTMKKIRLNLNKRSYNIVIGKDSLNSLPRVLRSLDIGRDAFIITNSKIKSLYGNRLKGMIKKIGYSVRYEIIPDTERAKSTSICIKVLNQIARYDRKKRIFIVAFGGGVVGDLAGFVASIYKRGISYIQIPTTLLSQVDSAIGGKVAIDLAVGKNLVGSFYQPKLVISDISLLKSLSLSEIKNGLAEIVKYGVIKDHNLFTYVEKNYIHAFKLKMSFMDYVISKCSKIKAEIVEKDETDKKDIRIILNYGHTVGHALEAAGNYRQYSHGEAVSMGMVIEAYLSYKLGHASYKIFLRIKNLLKAMGLPIRLKNVSLSKILEAQEHDKKIISGLNRFVLPTRIGAVKICENIPKTIIVSALKEGTSL